MMGQEDKLTLQEVEQLCRLYMDCKLSVLEETELRYCLTRIDFHTPLIDEVRQIMDLDTYISEKPFIKDDENKKGLFSRWRVAIRIAASVAIVLGIGMFFFKDSSIGQNSEQTYCFAYINGHRLSDEEARSHIEAEERFADNFIKEMSELEARDKQIIDNFSIGNILEQ